MIKRNKILHIDTGQWPIFNMYFVKTCVKGNMFYKKMSLFTKICV